MRLFSCAVHALLLGEAYITHQPYRGYSRIARTNHGKSGRFVNRPYRLAEEVYTVGRGLAPAVSRPSPLGKGDRVSAG